MAALIIVSGWERYGRSVLPFYSSTSGSHEPLQGDASSGSNRNFTTDAAAAAVLIAVLGGEASCAVLRRTDGRTDGGRSGERRLAVSPDIGLY